MAQLMKPAQKMKKIFKHHFTLFYILKTMICFAGFAWLWFVEQTVSEVLATVGALSLLMVPVFAWLESQAPYTNEIQTSEIES